MYRIPGKRKITSSWGALPGRKDIWTAPKGDGILQGRGWQAVPGDGKRLSKGPWVGGIRCVAERRVCSTERGSLKGRQGLIVAGRGAELNTIVCNCSMGSYCKTQQGHSGEDSERAEDRRAVHVCALPRLSSSAYTWLAGHLWTDSLPSLTGPFKGRNYTLQISSSTVVSSGCSTYSEGKQNPKSGLRGPGFASCLHHSVFSSLGGLRCQRVASSSRQRKGWVCRL